MKAGLARLDEGEVVVRPPRISRARKRVHFLKYDAHARATGTVDACIPSRPHTVVSLHSKTDYNRNLVRSSNVLALWTQ